MKHRMALFALLYTLGTSHLECQTPAIHVYPNKLKNWFLTLPSSSSLKPTSLAHVVQHELVQRRYAASNLKRWLCQNSNSSACLGIELTDHILPRISPQVSQQFYQMLQEIDLLFKSKEVTYWLTAGSLLGAVRHQGIIPWDDDIDLCIFDKAIATIISLRSDLHKLGYALYVSPDYMKIYLANGRSIPKKEGDFYPWKYPFVDLFPMKQEEDRVVYASERLRKGVSPRLVSSRTYF